jgi:hypothetical protein
MLVRYSREKGVVRGVVETFDGKHPCKMCMKAAELRKRGQQPDPQSPQREKIPIRLSWGEMVPASCLIVFSDTVGYDCQPRPATTEVRLSGRDMDSPVVPPPESA